MACTLGDNVKICMGGSSRSSGSEQNPPLGSVVGTQCCKNGSYETSFAQCCGCKTLKTLVLPIFAFLTCSQIRIVLSLILKVHIITDSFY